MDNDAPRVVLVGPPASGKTRIGKALARTLGEPFVDTDSVLVERFGPIPEIFAKHGEAWFRAREVEVVTECLGLSGVLSLGGGAVTQQDTREALAHHTVVSLTISPEAVGSRLNNAKRPLLDGLDSWKALVAARQPWYDQVATTTVDVSHRPTQDVADDIAGWLDDNHG